MSYNIDDVRKKNMNVKRFFLSLPLLALTSCALASQSTGLKAAPVPLSLEETLQQFDFNYTRTTQIYWDAEAYQEILESGKNTFPFTSTRTTLFVENGLYMYTSDGGVNSGYYTKESVTSEMRHYRIEGGKDERDNEEALFSEDSFSANVNVNEYYVGLHSFHLNENMDLFADLFEFVEDDSNGYYKSTSMSEDALVLKDVNGLDLTYSLEKALMYFTAPCYTNPILDGENTYFTFKEARIKLNNSDELIVSLYANEVDQLDSDDGLFSRAVVSQKGITTIKALEKYI